METVKFDLNSNLFITTLTQFCKDTDITLQSHTSNNTFYIKQIILNKVMKILLLLISQQMKVVKAFI